MGEKVFNCENCMFSIYNNEGDRENIYCNHGVLEIPTEVSNTCDDHILSNETNNKQYTDCVSVLTKEDLLRLFSMFNEVELWKLLRDNITEEMFCELLNMDFNSDKSSQINDIIKLHLKNNS